MRHSKPGSFQRQFSFLRRQFLQDQDLPFGDILSEEIVAKALTTIEACWLDRIYTPLVTLWVFLGQVLSEDHSCRWAVARLIAHRVSRGEAPCSAETGGVGSTFAAGAAPAVPLAFGSRSFETFLPKSRFHKPIPAPLTSHVSPWCTGDCPNQERGDSVLRLCLEELCDT